MERSFEIAGESYETKKLYEGTVSSYIKAKEFDFESSRSETFMDI